MADPLDPLYDASLEEFISARRAVAKELNAAGDTDRAAEVEALRKPSVTVWALNQAARRDQKSAQALDRAATKVAAVQARRAHGDLRSEQDRLREVSSTLVDEAEQALRDAGRSVSDTVGTRLHELVRAVAADEEARGALAAGRLLAEPELGGFAALGVPGTVAPAPPPAMKATPSKADEAKARRAAEREAKLAELRSELRDAEREAAEAQRAADRADRRAEAARRSLEQLERRAR